MQHVIPKQAYKRFQQGLWPYAGIACVLAAAFLLFDGMPAGWIKIGMGVILAGLCCLMAIWYTGRRLNRSRLLVILLIAGIVLRIGYMLYTPYTLRQHDLGTIDGHQNLAYIMQIFLYGRLPANNVGLFYHPPVAFFLEAMVMKGYAFITPGGSLTDWAEAAKLVPAFASCALLVVCRRLFKELGFPRRAMVIAMAVLAFQPTFLILAASINNDMLVIFWMAVSLLYTVKWYKNQTLRNIFILAVSIGLATTTKASGALFGVLVAIVFLVTLLQKQPAGYRKKLAGQFVLFGVVCLPLSLWYAARNWLLFKQSFSYVLPMSTQSALYIGWHSLISRFLTFPVWQIAYNFYCNPYGDYNLWLYLLKCSVFGEFSFYNHGMFALPLLLLNLVLVVLSLLAMVWVLRARDMPKFTRLLLGGLWFLQMASFLVFNLKYPFGCTMDFRYIVPTLFSGAGFLGLAADRAHRLYPNLAGRILPVVTCLIGGFAVVSAAFYLI